jgi:hypothetical protein
VLADVVLRSGSTMREQRVVERYEIRRRGCAIVARVEQEWPLGTAQLDVVFDANGLPLRVLRRTTMPDRSGPLGHVDTRVLELRTEPVGVVHRASSGAVERYQLLGAQPRAVIGPGRGLLTVWLQRARLAVGGRLREWVLDVREPVPLLREVTLQRRADQQVEGLGSVRVYTIFGREPVFADEHDVVIGDMFGLRRADAVEGPVPDPMPDLPVLDPTEAL